MTHHRPQLPFLSPSPSESIPTTPSSTASLISANPFARSLREESNIWHKNSPYAPYPARVVSNPRHTLLTEKFSLPPNPQLWGLNVSPDFPEPDDDFHNPDEFIGHRRRPYRSSFDVFSRRGLTNVGCLVLLCVGIVTLFAGYPVISFFTSKRSSTLGGFNIGFTNASGQIPLIHGGHVLIDPDTPQEAFTAKSVEDGSEFELVFSDEFNTEGRTFYPGDDPYWEAVDLYYWQTKDLEWYDPAAIITKDGALVITMSQKETHNLNYQSGMIMSWNKFCFTGGYIETSVVLPGLNNVAGLWPSIWTMGNLGRAGYGASLEGMWPYTYDACDVGTVANQSRLSRCTCTDDKTHPGPKHSDGSFVGRAAPEIDVFEAQVKGDPLSGQVSQSGQWAPFNAGYIWQNTSDNEIIADSSISTFNPYVGGVTQQATSVVTETNQECYEKTGGCYSIYGFEYKPGFDGAYIAWIANGNPSWTIRAAGMGADLQTQISARPISQEPMYIIMNLAMSTNFGPVDTSNIAFPVSMYVDYVRVYQPKGARNIGCNPPDFPTTDYISRYQEAYTNPNLTTWSTDFQQPVPGNSFLGQC
ncbi:beta-glucan synthesis-associated [Gloeopeniophorella convolvens]|nr:beta-glucan synthesis-associated [Gloeopeniophorella convolvens]